MLPLRMSGLALLIAVLASDNAAAQPTVGARAPDIDLGTLNGGRMQLSKLRGRPVILTFWGTWCPPCRTEFPELVRLHLEHEPAGLYIIGVNGRDQERNTRDVQQFVDTYAVRFPIVLDKRGRIRRAYRISGQPTTVFIDSSGIIRAAHTGLIDREELDRGLALILPQT